MLLSALLAALLLRAAAPLQPLPTLPRQPRSAARLPHLFLPGLPQLAVQPCNGSAAQAFALDAATRAFTLLDGRCLLRDAVAFNGLTVGACTGAPDSAWTVAPCTAAGCSGNASWLASAQDGLVAGLPGAVGPWVALWTADNPTGACHNELWAWSPPDGTLRSLNTPCRGGPPTLNGCLSVVPPPPSPPGCPASAARRVDCWQGVWDAAPARTPSAGVSDGPLLGNGDLGSVLGAAPAGGLTWWLGKGDMWATNTAVDAAEPALHSDTFYSAVAAGSVTLAPAGGAGAGAGAGVDTFTATQSLGSATVSANATSAAGGSLLVDGAYIAAAEGTLVLPFTVTAGGLYDFTLAQATIYGLPLAAGVEAGAGGAAAAPWTAWAVKGGVTETDNALLLMPCDSATYVIHPSVNTWRVGSAADGGRLELANGTGAAPRQCPSVVPSPRGPKLSIRACPPAGGSGGGDGGSAWVLVTPSTAPLAPPASLELRSAANASLCAFPRPHAYHNSAGGVALGECAAAPAWWSAWDAAAGQLRFGASQCLTAVPPNVNITLALALSVIEAGTGRGLPLAGSSAPPPSAAAAAATATLALAAGTRYLALVSAVTTRDTGWAQDPLQAARASLARYAGPSAPAALQALAAAHAAAWGAFWAASEVNLGQGRALLESFWYGSQYLLGCTARAGAVAPGLWGVFAVRDDNGWNGDLTLDVRF